jgi:hypothetical protein
MRGRTASRLSRAGTAGGVAALAFAVLVSVSAAVSPSGAPAVSAQYPKKVIICHKTGSKKNPFRTIRVSRNAVKAHLKHGDSLEPCSTAIFTLCDLAKGKAPKTVKVKGAKKAVKHLRQGDRLGKCKKSKKAKQSAKRGSEKPTKKGQASENPRSSSEKGKPANTPGKGGKKGRKGK